MVLSGLHQFEGHRQAGHAAAGAFGFAGPQSHRRERAFDRVAGAKMLPVLGGEVVERQQFILILQQAFDRLGILGLEALPRTCRTL